MRTVPTLPRSPFSAITKAFVVAFATLPLMAQAQEAAKLEAVTVTAKTSQGLPATMTAPSQSSLEAHSAQSLVGELQLRDYTSPIADYTQALNMTPGMFSTSPNGVGLGDAKITMRGATDSNMVFSFDGIPFNDTNGVSHHSWVFFPSQFIGGISVDRSPGRASTIGQATFSGSVDFRSRALEADPRTSVILSSGTWNTNLISVEHETGQFGADGKTNFLFAVQNMKSDGYQTYNAQERSAFQLKWEHENQGGSTLTLFASYLNLKTNTPNIKGVARSGYDNGDYTTLLSGDPTKANYFGYNFYDISTDFVYAGLKANLGDGWKFDNKAYTYRYWNKQNYNGTTISATSAVDKLNSYTTIGDVARFTRESDMGTLSTGIWFDQAKSYRFQVPSDPRTWVDSLVPNFSETYTTTTVQPYIEFEYKVTPDLKITPGLKYASYTQDFIHLADNGGAVGSLGGAPSIANSITYTDVLPAIDVRYQFKPNWTMYAQYALGDQIPSTSVFDVPNAKASPVPSPTKTTTIQVGTVWTSDNLTLAADIYKTNLDSTYTKSATADSAGNFGWYASGTQTSQGIEAEANLVLGQGFSLYANATSASLKYDSNGKWVAGAPSDTETLALNYQMANWSVGASSNRIGQQFNDDSLKNNEAIVIDPYVVSNLYVNYTIKAPSKFAKALKLQLGVNNVFDVHAIAAIANAAAGSTTATPKPTDLLTLTPGRSVQLTATLDF
jgi:iron complex outermembrane receptor protein